IRVFDSSILSGGRRLGNGQLASLGAPLANELTQPNEKITASLDAALYWSHGASSHELQAGVYFETRVQGNHLTYTNDGFIIEEHILRQQGDPTSGTLP